MTGIPMDAFGGKSKMTPGVAAHKCFDRFNDLTKCMTHEDRWAVAEGLLDLLEMVLSERTEKQIRDDAY